MAGLGSIFSYPVLLSLGVPPVNADVTNTAALIFTGVGASASSGKELRSQPKMAGKTAFISLIGGIVGSLILVEAPATSFQKVVPFLILLAAILMQVSGHRKQVRGGSQNAQLSPLARALRVVAVFLVGLYIGYFGASAGIILLAILSFTNNLPFAVNNAIKNFSSLVTNVFSLVIYAMTTRVYWAYVWPLGVGFFIGGYIGPIFIRKISPRLMRNVISAGAFVLACLLFYTAYL